MPEPDIVRYQFETKSKNVIQVFFNRETSLLVVDLVAKNDKGGNEIVRMTLDEKKLLAHLK